MSSPLKINQDQSEVFRSRLTNQLNPHHGLYVLSQKIDWQRFEQEFSHIYISKRGQPPKPIRLMVGLLMLQHMEGVYDEAVVRMWVENPYWQYFCGYDFIQWRFPIDPSSLVRWRQRLGPEGMEKILAATIQMAVNTGTVKPSSLETVIADTTVMEKAIAHPVDSKLLDRARQHLVKLCKQHNISLRQTYTRLGRNAVWMAGRYAHAGQFKRMRKQLKTLKNYLGRVVRDVSRQIADNSSLHPVFAGLLAKSTQLLNQTKTSKDKLYSLHAPEVGCIAKGKTHKRYEFGCKVALTVTHKEGLVLSSQGLPGNPYDGHTLKNSLNQARRSSGQSITRVFVDKGYKGHVVSDAQVYASGQKRLTLDP